MITALSGIIMMLTQMIRPQSLGGTRTGSPRSAKKISSTAPATVQRRPE